MSMEDLSVLTFTNYGDTEKQNSRVTLSPMAVRMLSAQDAIKQNRPVKHLLVMFEQGDIVEIYVNDMDLLTIERAVGGYGFGLEV
jgi:hypothetical protein